MWKPDSMYSEYALYQPVILYGMDALWGLSSFPGARIAVISGSTLDPDVKARLDSVFSKRSLAYITRSWKGEPDIGSLRGSIAALEEVKPDVIVAVGGGSVIDGAKLCRLFYEFPYYMNGGTKLSQLVFRTKFIAIPTTPGSGAEISSAAVYLDTALGRKEMVVCHDLRPSVIAFIPGLVKKAPERLITASMLDAVGHIVEGYTSNRDNRLADIHAEEALSILYEEFSVKAASERDYLRIQYAGYLGGMVQDHCIVGAAHAIAHQLTRYHFPHGEAVALLLPGVIRRNCADASVEQRYNTLCSRSGIGSVGALLGFIETQLQKSGISDRAGEIRSCLSRLADDEQFIRNIMEDRGGKGSPCPLDKAYIAGLVEGFL